MANLHMDANFPGGGIDHARWDGNTLYFHAPLDNSPQSLWYFFRIRGGAGEKLTLIQKGLERVLGVRESRGYQPVVPVWKDGEDGPWQRVDESTILYTQEPLQFQFVISPSQPVCYVAFCFPYLKKNWDAFASSLPAGYVQHDVVGSTKAGRPFGRWLIRSPKANPHKLIIATARQHAGEVSGSYVLEGLLRRLTDGSAEMESLLETAAVCVFPIMDLDCVEEGRYGKDQAPTDFNRDWRWKPYHPEIQSVYREVERLSESYEIFWALDLHAPQPGGASYMPPARAVKTGSPSWNRMWNLALHYEEACKRNGVSFHLSDVDTRVLDWGGINNTGLTCFYYHSRWNCNELTLEYSYHRDGEERVLGIADWHVLGKSLAETLADHLLDADLSNEPDRSRIPAWAVPRPLSAWRLAQKEVGLEIADEEGAITITALEPVNRCWLTSPAQATAPKSWVLEADCDISLKAYASYYCEGLLADHANMEAILLKAHEPLSWEAPEAPFENAVATLSLIVENMSGTLNVKANEHQSQS